MSHALSHALGAYKIECATVGLAWSNLAFYFMDKNLLFTLWGLTLMLIASPSLAQTSGFKYLDEPMLENRRPLPSNAWSNHGHSFPWILDVSKQYYVRIGISKLLTDKQIEYYQRRGTNPLILYRYITEFGITPKENERLERAGVSFAIAPPGQMNAMHTAALSDLIVEGRVTALEGYPQGIYHTKVVLDVEQAYKDCATVSRRGRRDFWLLHTGPHQHGDHVDNMVYPAEPDFRIGEKVVILAGSHPMHLRRMVGSALWDESLDSLRDAFGPPDRLIRAASRSRADILEIYRAFKVVRNKFVVKGGGFRKEQPTDVMEREYFRDRVAAISNAQKRECRARVRRAETFYQEDHAS